VEEREVADQLGLQPLGEEHDDREDERRRPDDRRADKHRLGRGLEGVARPVVLLQVVLAGRSSRPKPNSFFTSSLNPGRVSIIDSS